MNYSPKINLTPLKQTKYRKIQARNRILGLKPWQLYVFIGLTIVSLPLFGFISNSFWDTQQSFTGIDLNSQQVSALGDVSYPDASDDPAAVSVTKTVDFLLLDKYGGSGISSATLTIYNMDRVQVDSLTTASDGTIATAAAWGSGTQFYVKADDGASSLMFFNVEVPKMAPADAESLSVNGPVQLVMFDYTAPTISVRDSAGNSYADTGDLNKTSGATPGTSSVVVTVTWFQGTDNDGYMSSYDPINNINWDAIFQMKVTGTNYELVTVTGFDMSVEKGSAIYYGKVLEDTSLTKWKVGNKYELPGTGSFTFSLDLSGYSGDAADLEIDIYYYADWNNFVQNGNLGSDKLRVIASAPHTINLID